MGYGLAVFLSIFTNENLVSKDSYNSPDGGEPPPEGVKELFGYCNCSTLGRKSRPSLCSSASVIVIALVVHDHLLSFHSSFSLCVLAISTYSQPVRPVTSSLSIPSFFLCHYRARCLMQSKCLALSVGFIIPGVTGLQPRSF